MIKLRDLTMEQLEIIRTTRNKDLEVNGNLRTAHFLTYEMQRDFYAKVINDRDSKHRYYSIIEGKKFYGMCGLTNIELENRRAEISIILLEKMRNRGVGSEAVDALIKKGFQELNLDNIYGECYTCNKALGFWEKIIGKYNGAGTYLHNTKYFQGRYYGSKFFNIAKVDCCIWIKKKKRIHARIY